MSLAATYPGGDVRPASFLPAIKCSNCGDEIEIARMGDHICSSAEDHHHHQQQQQQQHRNAPTTNPYTLQTWHEPVQYQAQPSPTAHSFPRSTATTFAASPLQHARSPSEVQMTPPALQPGPSNSLRSTRGPALPRINADQANKPFLAPSYPRSASPASPVMSTRSGRSGSSAGSRPPFARNLTMPSPRIRDRAPSPELASNLDCAFPSFPVSTSRPGTSNGRRTPNTDRAPSRGGHRFEGTEPRSPRTDGGESVMKRANTIKNGPFEAGRRKGSREEKTALAAIPLSSFPAPPVQRPSMPDRQPSLERQAMPPRKSSLAKDVPSYDTQIHDEPLEDVPELSDMPAALRIGDRSNTFPLPPGHSAATVPELSRRPSEPPIRGRRPSLATSIREPMRLQQHETNVSTATEPRIDPRMHDAPPVPRPVQHYRQTSKHAPSDSASSASSTTQSYNNLNTSEGPSPVSSAASSIDAFSPISQASALEREDRPKSMGRPAGYSTKSQQQNPGLRAEQPAKKSPPPNFARPRLQSQSIVESPIEPMPSFQPELWSNNTSKASDTWPAPLAPSNSDDYETYKPLSEHPGRSRTKSVASEYSTYEPDPISSMAPPPIPAGIATGRPGLQRRNTSAKAVCRGCNTLIEGKSVKAADGRLTGRWHKHCFTCMTCHQPFATADFYVINDQPYCKQHYHEKNGSVCSGCQRGIEGQYLETSSRGGDRKFHPACFTCNECRLILSNDYFEINGRVYCERHAASNRRGPPGSYNRPGGYNNMPGQGRAERRTTKLMMM